MSCFPPEKSNKKVQASVLALLFQFSSKVFNCHKGNKSKDPQEALGLRSGLATRPIHLHPICTRTTDTNSPLLKLQGRS